MNKVLVRLYASLEIELTRIGLLGGGLGTLLLLSPCFIKMLEINTSLRHDASHCPTRYRLVRMLSLGHENALASIETDVM